MSNDDEYVSRTTKNQRRKTKEPNKKKVTDRILNILIVVVASLIIISLVIIISNDDLKSDITKSEPKEQNEHSNSSSQNNQSDSNEDNVSNEETGVADENQEEENSDEKADLSHITFVESNDSNVIQAWVNAKWKPYPTEQTGIHESVFNKNHIDYQEKIKLIYRDTEFTEDDSIIWSVKNASGNAIAVFSTLDKSEIYRLTMTWVDGKGWQTTLIEQLKSLEGAY